ncbi:MAG: hypothetical protein K2Q20_05940 [Phycisphaerales bacterium]|nr:hypothetical protein [Phycisphaerales bacterium]
MLAASNSSTPREVCWQLLRTALRLQDPFDAQRDAIADWLARFEDVMLATSDPRVATVSIRILPHTLAAVRAAPDVADSSSEWTERLTRAARDAATRAGVVFQQPEPERSILLLELLERGAAEGAAWAIGVDDHAHQYLRSLVSRTKRPLTSVEIHRLCADVRRTDGSGDYAVGAIARALSGSLRWSVRARWRRRGHRDHLVTAMVDAACSVDPSLALATARALYHSGLADPALSRRRGRSRGTRSP